MPQIARYDGKCVAMKMSCKPHTKYAVAITRNGTWVSDLPSAARTETSAVVSPGVAGNGMRSMRPATHAAGSMPSARTAKPRMPIRQPKSTASIWPSGADNSAPSEPAAVTAPSTTLRTLAGTACDATASAMPAAVQASEVPIRNPAPMRTATKPVALSEDDKARHIERRACHHERAKPMRTASAPATGCRKPQARFCTAIASVKSATVMTMSRVSGCMNSPRLWRTPMLIVSMTDAPSRMPMTGRKVCRTVIARLPAVLITQICVRKIRRPGIVSRKKVHRPV